jgi:hypothetical protein
LIPPSFCQIVCTERGTPVNTQEESACRTHLTDRRNDQQNDQSFFTLWHAILYTGFFVNALSVLFVAMLAIINGLLIDVLNLTLKPSVERVTALRLFAFLVPVVSEMIYFFAIQILHGIA